MIRYCSTLFCLAGSVILCAEAQAELTPAGQEISASIQEVTKHLKAINDLLAGVQDTATANAATAPMRKHTREMYIHLRKVQETTLTEEPSADDQALLLQQVIELQLMQATFEQHCMRLANNRFYNSIPLARLFHAIANIYQRQEQMGTQKQ